jgi:hypothetical protein
VVVVVASEAAVLTDEEVAASAGPTVEGDWTSVAGVTVELAPAEEAPVGDDPVSAPEPGFDTSHPGRNAPRQTRSAATKSGFRWY